MVFKDQCKLPARSPDSSRQARGFGNRFQCWQEGNALDICCCLMNFVQASRMVALGNFAVLEMADASSFFFGFTIYLICFPFYYIY